MQYKTTCNHCGKTYMVDGNPGQTIQAICPYCGAKANVVTPAAGQTTSSQRPERRKSSKPLFLRVTIWFLIAITVLFVVLAILYLIFTGVSK